MPICNKTKKCWLLTLLLSFPFTNLQQKFTGFFFILFVSLIYFLSDLSLAYKPIPYSMSICHEYFVIYLIFILFCVCTVSFLFLFFFLILPFQIQVYFTSLVTNKIIISFNIFLFDINFDKSTIELHFYLIYLCLQNFQSIKNQ